jgi:hypothetical protein
MPNNLLEGLATDSSLDSATSTMVHNFGAAQSAALKLFLGFFNRN